MTKNLHLHDLWVNFKQEDNYYNVPDFHEWRKEGDEIELVDQILVLKVNADTFNYIAFGENQIIDIAEMVENQAYYRKNHERIQVRYMFTMSDGERALTVKLDDDMRVMEKSHLIPRQYQLAIELVSLGGYHFENEYKYEISKYRNNAGLTRNEKESYKKLDEFLHHVSENDLPMIKYLLSEIDYPTYVTMRNGSFKDCLEAINNIPVSTVVEQSANIEKLLGKLSLVK
jgi:Protein of unknown function (DUF3603)